MSTLDLQSKNSASYTNGAKNSASLNLPFRHGKELTIGDIQDKTFNDSIFEGEQAIKDLTFEQLQGQEWTLQNKS